MSTERLAETFGERIIIASVSENEATLHMNLMKKIISYESAGSVFNEKGKSMVSLSNDYGEIHTTDVHIPGAEVEQAVWLVVEPAKQSVERTEV